MAKRLSNPKTFDEFEDMHKVHAPERKGREKQLVEKYIHDWRSFDDWDDVPLETFQRFTRRGSK